MYPDYVDALTLRGLVYMQLSQSELAEDSFSVTPVKRGSMRFVALVAGALSPALMVR